jgi:AraC-like DNA-binding protein
VPGRSLEFADFSLKETSYPAGARLARHYHAGPVLSFAIFGGTAISCGREPEWCEEGSLLYLAPGDPHENIYPDAAVRLHLEVSPRLWRQATRDLRADSGPVRRALVQRAARDIRSAFRRPDDLAEFTIATSLMDLIGILATIGGVRDRAPAAWLLRLRDYLDARCTEPFQLANVVEVAGRHPVHLSREFRRHFGKSMSAFIRERRLLWAAELIKRDRMALAEVALQCGFCDQSHFTNAFRKLMGISPAQYRARFTAPARCALPSTPPPPCA